MHDVEGRDVTVLPGYRLEGERDVCLWALSPCAVFTTLVLRLLTSVSVLRHAVKFSKAFSNEVNVFTMALDTAGDDKALLRRDGIHHELLHDSGIDIADVVLETEARHTESLVAVGSTEEEILVVGEGVVLAQVIMQVMAFLVLGAGNVTSENGSRLKSAVDHHLEHVSDIVLDAVASEVGALLIILHLHVAAGHLDHTVVDGLVGVLEGLQVGVLEGEEGA